MNPQNPNKETMENEEKNAVPAESAKDAAPADDAPAQPQKKKNRLLRALKRALIALAALVAVALIVVAFLLGPIVKFAANTFGASLLGVDKCSVGAAKIYPFGGYARFENILVGKPLADGVAFSRDLFSAELIEVDVDVFSLFSQKKVIDGLEVFGISANYEQLASGETNVGVLAKKFAGAPAEETKAAVAPAPKETPAPADETAAAPAEEIYIGARFFVVEDVKAAAYIRGVPFAFPTLSANFPHGIGMEENLTPVAFGMKVGGDFVKAAEFFRKSAVGDAARATAEALSEAAEATAAATKAAARATDDVAGAAVNAVSDAAVLGDDAAKATAEAVSDVAGTLRGLLSGKNSKKKKDGEERQDEEK